MMKNFSKNNKLNNSKNNKIGEQLKIQNQPNYKTKAIMKMFIKKKSKYKNRILKKNQKYKVKK